MPRYETSISIRAPREAVWNALSDVASWPAWLPTVTHVEPLDGGPLLAGRRYRVSQPKLQPVTWVVTELEPPHHFTWQGRSPGLSLLAEHVVNLDSAGLVRVVLRFSFAGPLGGLIGALYRSVTERYIASEAAALKQKVEGPR